MFIKKYVLNNFDLSLDTMYNQEIETQIETQLASSSIDFNNAQLSEMEKTI